MITSNKSKEKYVALKHEGSEKKGETIIENNGDAAINFFNWIVIKNENHRISLQILCLKIPLSKSFKFLYCCLFL